MSGDKKMEDVEEVEIENLQIQAGKSKGEVQRVNDKMHECISYNKI